MVRVALNEGEQVSFAYHPQMLFKNLFSNTENYYYVKGTSYDAAGRVTWRGLGADSLPATTLLQTNYTYNPWSSQGGRLLQMQTGVVTDTTSLQKLKYNYDPVGNITWIQNHKTGGGIQTQNFTYDNLDRLTSSNATGGIGGTYATETYSYSVATGNMASKAGVGYGYNDPEHIHAVTHLDGVQKYWYDLNGNTTTRVVDGNTYN